MYAARWRGATGGGEREPSSRRRAAPSARAGVVVWNANAQSGCGWGAREWDGQEEAEARNAGMRLSTLPAAIRRRDGTRLGGRQGRTVRPAMVAAVAMRFGLPIGMRRGQSNADASGTGGCSTVLSRGRRAVSWPVMPSSPPSAECRCEGRGRRDDIDSPATRTERSPPPPDGHISTHSTHPRTVAGNLIFRNGKKRTKASRGASSGFASAPGQFAIHRTDCGNSARRQGQEGVGGSWGISPRRSSRNACAGACSCMRVCEYICVHRKLSGSALSFLARIRANRIAEGAAARAGGRRWSIERCGARRRGNGQATGELAICPTAQRKRSRGERAT